MLDKPKQFLSSLPNKPGVYQMYDANHEVLYVGKAKNLKLRLYSYFRPLIDPKTKIFMTLVKSIEIIVTPNENAALLLESNLIKAKKPHYNILFKDDKSFPYLFISKHDFPRIGVHRGAVHKADGKYFGPFPDATAVNFVLNLLQKVFRVRVCKDSYMCNRSRPCMLHQINLCSAPCTECVDRAAYAMQIKLVEQFLHNKSDYVVEQLTKLMDEASAKQVYEQAANYRDQITSIRKVQAQQAIIKTSGNCDVIALVKKEHGICINVLFVRNGLVLGNKTYFPTTHDFISADVDVLSAFIMHYYLQDEVNIVIPDKIILNIKLPERLQVAAVLCEKLGRKIVISDNVRGAQKQLLTMAEANAVNSLEINYKSATNYAKCLLDFKSIMQLSSTPHRLECFDVSHTMGEAQVASCVVFNEKGPSKNNYRRFNIRNARAGDDYGALKEALERRYRDLKDLPDVIIIDGGRGQLSVAAQVLQTLGIKNLLLMAIAKGESRKPGLEKIFIYGRMDPLILPPQSFALHLMQQIRDEAHRFAISGHRRRMLQSRQQSVLENIVGVGKAKRTVLLKHFGGLSELRSVGIDELAKIKGVGYNLAKRIYDYLHG